MKNVIVVGAGGLARKILVCITRINQEAHRWHVKGFLDDNLLTFDAGDCFYPILGTISDYEPQPDESFIMAISNPHLKEKIANQLQAKGAKFETIIGRETILAEDAIIGEGSVIMTPCYIESGVKIGRFVTILGSTVSVDGFIGDFCTTTGFVNLTNSHLGKRVYVGSHAVICEGVEIGDDALIGVGSIVTQNVGPGVEVFGYPARAFIKKGIRQLRDIYSG